MSLTGRRPRTACKPSLKVRENLEWAQELQSPAKNAAKKSRTQHDSEMETTANRGSSINQTTRRQDQKITQARNRRSILGVEENVATAEIEYLNKPGQHGKDRVAVSTDNGSTQSQAPHQIFDTHRTKRRGEDPRDTRASKYTQHQQEAPAAAAAQDTNLSHSLLHYPDTHPSAKTLAESPSPQLHYSIDKSGAPHWLNSTSPSADAPDARARAGGGGDAADLPHAASADHAASANGAAPSYSSFFAGDPADGPAGLQPGDGGGDRVAPHSARGAAVAAAGGRAGGYGGGPDFAPAMFGMPGPPGSGYYPGPYWVSRRRRGLGPLRDRAARRRVGLRRLSIVG